MKRKKNMRDVCAGAGCFNFFGFWFLVFGFWFLCFLGVICFLCLFFFGGYLFFVFVFLVL